MNEFRRKPKINVAHKQVLGDARHVKKERKKGKAGAKESGET